jgi:hypothetical protein
MAFLAAPLAGLFSGTGGLLGGLIGAAGAAAGLGKKKKKPVVLPGPVRRDDQREALESGDALRRRKGAAADLITGTRGAEAAASSIGRLVVGG